MTGSDKILAPEPAAKQTHTHRRHEEEDHVKHEYFCDGRRKIDFVRDIRSNL